LTASTTARCLECSVTSANVPIPAVFRLLDSCLIILWRPSCRPRRCVCPIAFTGVVIEGTKRLDSPRPLLPAAVI
jgi:hypothetical protein